MYMYMLDPAMPKPSPRCQKTPVAVQINKIQLLTFSPERCKKELPRFPSRCTMELISVVSKSADAAQKENDLSENERIGRKNLIAIDLNSTDRDIEKVET